MNKKKKRKLIRKYFKRKYPKFFFKLIPIILFLLIIAVIFKISFLIYLSYIILTLSLIYNIYYFCGRASDKDIDKWLLEYRRRIEKLSLYKLNINEEQMLKDPVTLMKPIFWNIQDMDEKQILMKKGRDKLLRFSIWDTVIFVLTDKFISIYRTKLNLLDGNNYDEIMEEYFYKDIQYFGTTNEPVTLKDGTKINNAECLIIKTYTGNTICIKDISSKMKDKKMNVVPTTPIWKAIRSIRNTLREKKS